MSIRPVRRELAPPSASTTGGIDLQPPTERCKATHDVPYTLRCVLCSGHDQGGRHAVDVAHRDKNGRTW